MSLWKWDIYQVEAKLKKNFYFWIFKSFVQIIPNDVGGIMSNKRRKKSVSASKIEIHNVIFSFESDGIKNTKILKNDILIHGIIKFTK